MLAVKAEPRNFHVLSVPILCFPFRIHSSIYNMVYHITLLIFNSDKDVLEDRYWSLRKEYMDITDILNHNGFAWDGIRQTMTADDDVWEAYIKVLFFLICK